VWGRGITAFGSAACVSKLGSIWANSPMRSGCTILICGLVCQKIDAAAARRDDRLSYRTTVRAICTHCYFTANQARQMRRTISGVLWPCGGGGRGEWFRRHVFERHCWSWTSACRASAACPMLHLLHAGASGSDAVLSEAEPLTRPGCRSETSAQPQPDSPPCRTPCPSPYPQPAFPGEFWTRREILFADSTRYGNVRPAQREGNIPLADNHPAQGPSERCTGLGNAARKLAQRCCQICIDWLRSAGWPIPRGATEHSRDLVQEPTRQPGSAGRMWIFSAQPETEIKTQNMSVNQPHPREIRSPPC
jgi:hypothetical protein